MTAKLIMEIDADNREQIAAVVQQLGHAVVRLFGPEHRVKVAVEIDGRDPLEATGLFP